MPRTSVVTTSNQNTRLPAHWRAAGGCKESFSCGLAKLFGHGSQDVKQWSQLTNPFPIDRSVMVRV